MLPLTGILFTSFAMTFIGAQEDANKKATKQLQGIWQVVSITTKDAVRQKADIKLTFQGNQIVSSSNKRRSTFTIDAGKNPKHIDIRPESKKSKKILSIYKIENETLTFCTYNFGRGQPRPKAFRVEKGTDQMLIVLKQVAPK